ncbi:hypothetical protein FRACA_1150018 [Frankia canadensis]|uniref:Uncharacterized protein n=1 Tax=Frankia canadensis TaxID=1836972 RepID=A0A2I2KJN9_9ACTN|nr:hypothetical protein FRACA_1150018 [Frankia canadensis]SOU53154.1 hypothetical protein FRACA_1150018 [Frankia canadensis]
MRPLAADGAAGRVRVAGPRLPRPHLTGGLTPGPRGVTNAAPGPGNATAAPERCAVPSVHC